MDFFIKKIFEGKKDESVHLQFQKFSRGEFGDRAMVRVKNLKDNFVISTTSEYARDFVMIFGEKLGEKKVHVLGALISALDLTGFEYKEKKMAMGARKYIIDSEMSGKELTELCKKIPKAFFGLSFKGEDFDLSIQPKSPKSAKGASSSKKEENKSKIDFCKIKTIDKNIVNNLIFDNEAKDFKNVEIKHTFLIEDIILPQGEKDFAKIREMAQRKGKIIRKLDVDGKKIVKEVDFVA